MKITEALEEIRNTRNRVTRDYWYNYNLSFNVNGDLILKDGNQDLTPYVLTIFDFNYEWYVENK